MNDPYITGTHLNDVTVFGPIFLDGELVGFAATRAHWLDVGAKDPGGRWTRREIYQEGMRSGPTQDRTPVPSRARTSSTCSAATAASATRRSAT